MSDFKGFTDSETFTQIPDTFFRQLLNEIKESDELKVTLYAIWLIHHLEGPFRAISAADFDPKELGLPTERISRGLEKAVQRGSLLRVQKAGIETNRGGRNDAIVYFLLNSPKGRAGLQAIESGQWNPEVVASAALLERPNIFKLYEENIGPLTPLIADMLKEAEDLYPAEWFEEAFSIAVKNNKRYWKYIEAILRRWQEEGRHGEKDQQDSVKGSNRYTDSQFSEVLKRD